MLTTLPDNEQPVSLVENPEPDTMTLDPTRPDTGLSIIDIGRDDPPTVNATEAVSPVDPVTVTVKEPAPTLATTNEPLKVPPEIVHVEVPTTLPVKVQPVSLVENPEPDTMTLDPT